MEKSGNSALLVALWLLAISLAGVMAYLIAGRTLYVSVDSGIYLDAGRVILAGGRPYIDFVDINPPLAMYLHAPVVWLAQLTGTDPVAVFFAATAILTLAISLWSFELASRNLPEDSRLFALFIALTPIYSFYNFDPSWFGQREQLFVLALLPYMLLRVARLHDITIPLSASLGAGLLLGLMASLKPPQFVLILAGIELLICIRRRSLNLLVTPEIASGIAVAVLYAAVFFLFGGESFDSFVNRYMPLIVNSYDAMNYPEAMRVSALIKTFGFDIAIICIGWLAIRKLAPRGVLQDLSTLALMVGAIGFFLYIAQAKGFGYHVIPTRFAANLLLSMVAGLVLYKLFRGKNMALGRQHYVALLCIAFFLAGSLATRASANQSAYRYSMPLTKLIMQNSAPGDRVALFGLTPLWYFPMLVQQDRHLGTRYAFSFMVPMLYDGAVKDASFRHGYRVTDDRWEQEQLFKREIQEDISTLQPELLIIYRKDCFWCLQGLTMESYLLGQPEAFPFMQDYQIAQSDDSFLTFKRIGAQKEQ